MTLFTRHPVEQHTLVLAAYLPDGEAFASKVDPDANLYKFLLGLAETQRLVEDSMQTTYEEHDYTTTDSFISEWESAVGIPDSCFKGTGSIEERRKDIEVKILSNGTQTADDFIDLAAELGVAVNIVPGITQLGTRFPFDFPVTFEDDGVFPIEFTYVFPDVKGARFTMIVEFVTATDQQFPFEFPLTFGDERVELLQCLFKKLAPANVQVLFRQV